MEINQLKPVDIVRDEDGQWIHPDFKKYLDETFGVAEFVSQKQWDEMKRYLNIQTCELWLSVTTSCDDFEKMMDSENISNWNPIAPNGFFLINISFCEDDAYAIFAREIRKEIEVA